MTEIRQITVQAPDVRVGDRIFGGDVLSGKAHEGSTVTAIKNGTKNIVWTMQHGNAVAARREAKIIVEREVQTDAERRADRRAYTVENLWRMHKDWSEGVAPLLEQALDKARKYPERADVLDYSDIGKMMQAQARAIIAGRIGHTIQRMRNPETPLGEKYGGLSNDEMIITAFALTVIEFTERSTYPNPLSRSTAVLDNVIDDVNLWAERELINQLRWHDGGDVRDRVAQLQGEARRKEREEQDRIMRGES